MRTEEEVKGRLKRTIDAINSDWSSCDAETTLRYKHAFEEIKKELEWVLSYKEEKMKQ